MWGTFNEMFESMAKITEDSLDIVMAPVKVAVAVVEPVVRVVADGANAVVDTTRDIVS